VRTDTGPFVIIPEWVLDSGISDRAIRLYCTLGRYADDVTGEAYPSRRTLGKRLGCSTDSIDRAKNELVEVGALSVVHRKDEAGDPTSNLYTVHRVQLRRGGREAAGTGGRGFAAQNENQPKPDTPYPLSASEEEGGAFRDLGGNVGSIVYDRSPTPEDTHEMLARIDDPVGKTEVGLEALARLRDPETRGTP